MPWETIKNEDDRPLLEYQLEKVVRGFFDPELFLDYMRYFVLFEDDGDSLIKKIAGYHQFHGVRKAVDATMIASGDPNDPFVRRQLLFRFSDNWNSRCVSLSTFVRGFRSGLLCRFDSVAGDVELDDHAVMHQAVDCCRCCHRVFEDLIPLAERKVARQQHAAAFVTFRQKSEQNLHLLSALLNVAQVVDDQALEAAQLLDQFRKTQVAFGDQQLLNQQAARREQHTVTLKNQLLRQRT